MDGWIYTELRLGFLRYLTVSHTTIKGERFQTTEGISVGNRAPRFNSSQFFLSLDQ